MNSYIVAKVEDPCRLSYKFWTGYEDDCMSEVLPIIQPHEQVIVLGPDAYLSILLTLSGC